MKKPNFFIVGAPKCGTTALTEYLRSHPNIFMSQPKEPHYFSQDFVHSNAIQNFEQYIELFQGATQKHLVVGEASVWYLYSSVAIQNIYNFNPNAKIVVMLRNPVDMIYSLHSQLLYVGAENEKDFQRAWHLIETRKNALLNYSEIGKLGDQVQKLLNVFPREQVYFILFDEFTLSTKIVYEKVLHFLSIDNDFRENFPVINENKVNRINWLSKFLIDPPENTLGARKIAEKFNLKPIINRQIKIIYSMNNKKIARKPLDKKFRLELVHYFSQDIKKLEEILKISLKKWRY